jgi:hypothetical protein
VFMGPRFRGDDGKRSNAETMSRIACERSK